MSWIYEKVERNLLYLILSRSRAKKIDENGASLFKINHHLQLQITLKPYSQQTLSGIFRFFAFITNNIV